MISAPVLAVLLERCAPRMDRTVAASIVAVESLGDAWAIDDDSTRRSYHPPTYAQAVTLAHELLEEGHSIDLGLAQVNSVHLGAPGISVEAMLRPCANLRAGEAIYAPAFAASGDVRIALAAYNGAGATSQAYADRVLEARSSPFVADVLAGGLAPRRASIVLAQARPVVVRHAVQFIAEAKP
jgi:type IV secretion system protein VirB1